MMQKFFLSFVGIFVALDIIGTLPMFLGMTQGLSRKERGRVINTSMWVAFVVALAFLFTGQTVFKHLSITIFDFKIAGGLVLLLVSLADLASKPEVEGRASGSTGIVPIAVPLITGPAILTTLILQVGSLGRWMVILSLLANYVLAWTVLRNSHWITKILGKDGTVVISKLAALLLAAIAVSMIRSGVFESVMFFRG